MIRLFLSLIIFSICFVVSCKDMRFVKFFGSALGMSSLLATVLSNYFGLIEMDDELAMHELRQAVFSYLLYIGLFSTEFWHHMIIRIIWWLSSSILLTTLQYQSGKHGYHPCRYRNLVKHALNRAHFLCAHEDSSKDVLDKQSQRVLREAAH